MNRELRRERTRNKWISRARKIYNSWGTFDVPIRGIKHSYPNTIATYRDCESITDFLNDSIFAKKLKHSTTPWRSKMHQYDVKKENRKKRYEAKKIIKEECEDDIQRESGEEYLDHYIYKSRNECNQIIVCEVYRTYNGTLNFAFYITTKRKHGYQEGKTTGKDGMKSLLWAKKCLLDFIDYAKWKFPGDSIEVYPDDERRRKVYALLPLGFKIMKDKYKTLIYKDDIV